MRKIGDKFYCERENVGPEFLIFAMDVMDKAPGEWQLRQKVIDMGDELCKSENSNTRFAWSLLIPEYQLFSYIAFKPEVFLQCTKIRFLHATKLGWDFE